MAQFEAVVCIYDHARQFYASIHSQYNARFPKYGVPFYDDGNTNTSFSYDFFQVYEGGTWVKYLWECLPSHLKSGVEVEFSNGARYQILSPLGTDNSHGRGARTAYIYAAVRMDEGASHRVRGKKVALRIEKHKFRILLKFTKFSFTGAQDLARMHVPHTHMVDALSDEYLATQLLEPWQIPIVEIIAHHRNHQAFPDYDDDAAVKELRLGAEAQIREKIAAHQSTRMGKRQLQENARLDALTEEQEIDEIVLKYREINPNATDAEVKQVMPKLAVSVKKARALRQEDRDDPDRQVRKQLERFEQDLNDPVITRQRLFSMGKLFEAFSPEDFQAIRDALVEFARKTAWFTRIDDLYLFQFAYDRKTKQVLLFDWSEGNLLLTEKQFMSDAEAVKKTGKDFRNPFSFFFVAVVERLKTASSRTYTYLTINQYLSVSTAIRLLISYQRHLFSYWNKDQFQKLSSSKMADMTPSFFMNLYALPENVFNKPVIDNPKKVVPGPEYGDGHVFVFKTNHLLEEPIPMLPGYEFLDGLEAEIAQAVAEERAKPGFLKKLRALHRKANAAQASPCKALLMEGP